MTLGAKKMLTASSIAKLEEATRRAETYGYQIPKLNDLVIKHVRQAGYTPSNIDGLRKKLNIRLVMMQRCLISL